jgi:serine/threonine protein kinase
VHSGHHCGECFQVLKLLGVFKHGPHVVLVLQRAQQSLYSLLVDSRAPLEESWLASVLGQVLRALAHAHDSGWCHRDVTPGNVLLLQTPQQQQTPQQDAVLADWGQALYSDTLTAAQSYAAVQVASVVPQTLSPADATHRGSTLDQVGLPHDAVGTRWYKPPEVLFGASSGGAPGDIWAFGMVLAEALNEGEPLCAGGNDIMQLGLLLKTFGPPDETQWPAVAQLPDYGKLQFVSCGEAVPLRRLLPGASPHALEAVRGCLQLTPGHRMSAKALLKLPYFSSVLES